MNERIREMLSWYASENPGVHTNLARMLNHGRLAGTGKMVILPVDQGFEHGPARSFAPNLAAYDPRYHFELAIEAGCNAYAAQLGALEAGVSDYCGDIPLILKCSNHDLLYEERDPLSAVTSWVDAALRLGCVAVGFTMYPGSMERTRMYEELRTLTAEAKAAGLAVVVWAYPRGSSLSKEGETAIDVVAYAAQIAAQLGADIIKVKLPSAKIELPEAQKTYQQYEIPIAMLADRVHHIVNQLAKSCAIWLMVPAALVDATLAEVVPFLAPGDVVIDGGNSYYHDDIRREAEIAKHGIHYLGVATSGGVRGLERGFCLMIGGGGCCSRAPRPDF